MTSSSSPQIPTWTTSRPFYDRSEHTVNYHDGYGHGESRYQDHGSFHPEWKPSSGNMVQPSDSNYRFQDHLNRQWAENRRTDQIPQRVSHSEGSWLYEHRNQDHRYDHGHYPPGYHYHHHHHHYHNYGPTTNPPANPSWNSASPTATIGDRRYDQGYQGYTPNADDSQRRSDHDHHYDSNHYDHHYFEHAASSETDQRRFQSYLPPKEYNEDNIQFHNEHNETKFFGVTHNLPVSQRTDHDLPPNRQDYSRTNPGLYYSNFNHTFLSAGNVLLNSNKFAENRNQNESRQNRLSPLWTGQENIAWNQPNGSFGFKPSTSRGQQNQEVQMEIQTRRWNQGK